MYGPAACGLILGAIDMPSLALRKQDFSDVERSTVRLLVGRDRPLFPLDSSSSNLLVELLLSTAGAAAFGAGTGQSSYCGSWQWGSKVLLDESKREPASNHKVSPWMPQEEIPSSTVFRQLQDDAAMVILEKGDYLMMQNLGKSAIKFKTESSWQSSSRRS
ncbi:hypothetical protein SELMODRAFT_444739 [Selaginella moellendorffii]|uniref:Uncharacterized protein n=1 Tax=Selaginella moellendorffii TaxID=88036 RepID=D8SCG9_SELML|nr:hypothetical protein SELMODRAFT_444739 [Selaginella moellendorffii]